MSTNHTCAAGWLWCGALGTVAGESVRMACYWDPAPAVFVWTAYQPQHSAIKTSLFLKTTMSNFLWIGFIGFTIWWEVDHSPYQRKYSQYFLPKKRSLKSQQPTFLFIEKIINMNTGRVKMWKTVECCYSWCFDRQLKYKLRVVCTI